MKRWYKCFSSTRSSQDVRNQIRRAVEGCNLQKVMPVVHIQRHPESMRGRYYLYLAIVSDVPGIVPGEVEQALIRLPHLTPFRDQQSFTYDEIAASTDTDAYDHTLTIDYRVPLPAPIDLEAFADLEPPTGDPELSEAYHRLLLLLSAAGSGSWASFRDACRALGLVSEYTTARSILRTLKLLGHVEASADGSQWCVAPAVLAQTDAGAEAGDFFLCGARDEGLLSGLRSHALVSLTQQPYASGVPAVTMRLAEDAAASEELPVQVVRNAARRLAELLPPVKVWQEGLVPVPGVRPDIDAPNLYQNGHFEAGYFGEQPGFYEFPSSGNGRPARYLFYDAAARLWRQGEWYGLRYLALQEGDLPCPVCYSANTCRLAVPAEWRWPEVYERALVLASGTLPTYRSAWLVYEAIGHETLELLIPKLNLRVEETEAYA